MESQKNILFLNYHVVSYLQFCTRKGTSGEKVQEEIKHVREALKSDKKVVFIDWEHERVLRYLSAYNFVGFEEILGEYYDTNKWAVSIPTFGHTDFGTRQIHNLDFLIYVNSFNKDFDTSQIDHSKKVKDFVYLNGKPHPHRVNLLKEMKYHKLLENSIWSASSPHHQWNEMEAKLPSEYELPEWQGKSVDGYHDTTRQVNFPMYNDSICTVVPETLADNDCHYITEKTCKPIMAEHLFVVLSGAGYLKNLRSLGFKTFGQHFDESYDDCVNLNERVSRIVATLKQIKSMDTDKLYEDTKHIRKHNRELFFDEDFYKDFNSAQIEKLKNFFS